VEIIVSIACNGNCKLILSPAGAVSETSRNSTGMSEAEVSLKLNKRGPNAIWAFEIRGKVGVDIGKPDLDTDSHSEQIWTSYQHHARDHCYGHLPQEAKGAERADVSSSRCES
jgi:hypothetical protein